MNTKKLVDKLYENTNRLPWYEKEIPKEIIELAKKIPKCRVLEIGCGAGNVVIYLAKKGFDVTGIDLSSTGIEYAKKQAKKQKVKANFKVYDALKLQSFKERFDLVIEWGILHWIPFSKREKYVRSVSSLLSKEGLYLSLSFNVDSPQWGKGRIRTGASGAKLYFSSLEELKELYEEDFDIIEMKKRSTRFRNLEGMYVHNYFLMKRI